MFNFSVNACTDQGRSCLLYACSRNRLDVAKLLLGNHADINLQDKLGAGPLHRAAARGNVKYTNPTAKSYIWKTYLF